MHFLIHNPKANLRRMDAGETPAEAPARVQANVGVIPIVGALTQRPDWFSCGSTYMGICAVLERFEAEPAISAIVLDVDSCGGSADGVFELAEKIRACTKPVIAYGRGLVASAAYLLFAAAKYRVAHRSALLGSVGAYECFYVGESDEIKYIVSTQSPNKVPDPTQPEGEKVIQARVDALAEIFIADLATYFNTTPEKVKSDFGGGEVIFATSAQPLGMVDEVGNFKTALASIGKIQNTVDSMTGVTQRTQQKGDVERRASGGKKNMARKMALVVTDDSNVNQGAETFEITVDFIKQNFPDVYDAIQKAATEAASAETAAVEEAAKSADMENPEEQMAVAQARAGKMTAIELTKTLLTAKAKYAGSDEAKKRALAAARGKDQPAVIQASAAQFGEQVQKPNIFAKFVGKK